MLRAVLDTNVVLAAERSREPASPNREIMTRWRRGKFTLLYSADIALEYAEMLEEHGIEEADLRKFLRTLGILGERVEIRFYHLRNYPVDADDICFVLCALNGKATHIVTYDRHLLGFVQHDKVKACEPLDFLRELRASVA
jgi:predicted nucleic acid-binding protein